MFAFAMLSREVWRVIGDHVAECDSCEQCKGVPLELRRAVQRYRARGGRP